MHEVVALATTAGDPFALSGGLVVLAQFHGCNVGGKDNWELSLTADANRHHVVRLPDPATTRLPDARKSGVTYRLATKDFGSLEVQTRP